jgi:hypothetical protein
MPNTDGRPDVFLSFSAMIASFWLCSMIKNWFFHFSHVVWFYIEHEPGQLVVFWPKFYNQLNIKYFLSVYGKRVARCNTEEFATIRLTLFEY